mmetsp:Transcript_92636/g.193645  ORF Transcript_92636/g.193645 Transcript_92636/m.193645 type:complete len:270 (-) Transcript_92636:1249-2058(-)
MSPSTSSSSCASRLIRNSALFCVWKVRQARFTSRCGLRPVQAVGVGLSSSSSSWRLPRRRSIGAAQETEVEGPRLVAAQHATGNKRQRETKERLIIIVAPVPPASDIKLQEPLLGLRPCFLYFLKNSMEAAQVGGPETASILLSKGRASDPASLQLSSAKFATKWRHPEVAAHSFWHAVTLWRLVSALSPRAKAMLGSHTRCSSRQPLLSSPPSPPSSPSPSPSLTSPSASAWVISCSSALSHTSLEGIIESAGRWKPPWERIKSARAL